MALLDKFSRSSSPRRLPIFFYGHPVLREKAKRVEEVTLAVQKLAERMVVTMYENEIRGVGLAAPQVGRGLRLVIIDTSDPETPPPPTASPGEIVLEPRMPLVLVNPEILSSSGDMTVVSEGCLSVPDISGDVARLESVILKSDTLDGETIQVECGGLLARCLQHEIDHLNGILFVDRMTPEDKKGIETELSALERKVKKSLPRGQRDK